MMGATLRDGLLVMTFRNSREHCGRLDCACNAKRELAFDVVSERLCMAEKACLSP